MSDDELLCRLERLEQLQLQYHHYEPAQTIREAIRRLTPTPPPEGSVEVRVAVSRGTMEGQPCVYAQGIDVYTSERTALGDVIANAHFQATHGPVIAVITLPSAVVPEVKATRAEVANG